MLLVESSSPKRGASGSQGSTLPRFEIIWRRPERNDRSRKPPLNRARIVQAAIELADERGLAGISTRAIAERLRTGPTSMYWHVPTTADLHELILDTVISEIPLAPRRPSDGWREVMRRLGLATLAVYVRHPWAAMLGIQPGVGPGARAYGEYAIQTFADAGVAADDAIAATAVINNYIFGFAVRHAAWEQAKELTGLRDQWKERLDQYVAEIQRDDAELAAYLRTRITLTSTGQFEAGLDCVLEGIARRVVEPDAVSCG